jgi:TolB-like protein
LGPVKILRFGVFELDVVSGELRKQGLRVRLPDQPLQILLSLLERPGETVTRDALRQRLWPDDTFVDFDAGLNTAIKKLRDALGDPAENPRFIETVPRRGYRFLGHVEESADRPPEGVRWVWSATAAAGIMVTLLVWTSVGAWRARRADAIPGPITSIVVLPFENLSGDPAQAYFADGMTEALTTDLAQIRALRVISRTSAMQYKDAKKPLSQIARELNVDAAVVGAVVRDGDRVRITAQLIHAGTDRHVWAQSYERQLRDVLSLQMEVAGAIAAAVKVELRPDQRQRLARA